MTDNRKVEIASEIPAIASDAELGRRVVDQAFELWINPELERRRVEGGVPEGFGLWAAQRMQRPNGEIIVRLNEEIRGFALLRATRDVEKGDDVHLSDFEGLESFDVVVEELDSGHWTVLWTGTRWFTSFNFLTHRAQCLALLGKSEQFYIAAKQAVAAGHAAVAVDTLSALANLRPRRTS